MLTRGTAMSYVSRLALAGLVLSIAVLLTVVSVVNGFERELRLNVLGLLPHMTVLGIGGMTADEVAAVVPGPEQDAGSEIAAAAPFVQGMGLITGNGKAQGVAITGVEIEQYATVSRVAEFLETGAGRGLNEQRFGVLVGRKLADSLGVGIGDRVVLVLPAATVTPAGVILRKRAFTVIDTFSSQSVFESSVVYVALGDAQKLFRLRDRVHGVHARLHDLFRTGPARGEIAQIMDPDRVTVRSWVSSQGNLYQAIAVQKLTMFVLLSFLVGVAAFNLVSGLVMIVEQRKSDVAILRSMGADTALIVRLFSLVGVLLSLAGITLGILVGVLLASSLPWLYATLTTAFGVDLMNQYFISYLPVDVRTLDVIGVAVTAFVLAVLATLYPAWRAARLLPSTVLAHE